MNYQFIKHGNKVELRHNLDIGTSILVKSSGSEPQWIDISWIFSDTDYFAGYYVGDRVNFFPNYDPDKPPEDWFIPAEYCSSSRGWTGYYSEGVVCRGRLQVEAATAVGIDLWNYYDMEYALLQAGDNCEYTGQSEKERLKQRLIDNNYWINEDIFKKLMDDIGGASVNGGYGKLRGFVAEQPYWRIVYYTTRSVYKVFFNSALGYKVQFVSSEWDVGGSQR